MKRRATTLAAWLLAAALVFASGATFAQTEDKVLQFSEQLRANPDFRVRTQAALALGATQDKRAVEPLCTGLEDENTTVRAAAAAALGKLQLGGQACLEQRLKDETNASVRTVIEKAIERLRGGGGGVPLEGAKYYVGIGQSTNKSGRADDALDTVVRSSLAQQLVQLPGFATAPRSETPDQARAVLGKYKQLKPFFIWPKVTVIYANGNLTVTVELSLFTYPGKAFKGAMSRNLTMPDTPTRDVTSEDELIQAAAEVLVPELAKLADRL